MYGCLSSLFVVILLNVILLVIGEEDAFCISTLCNVEFAYYIKELGMTETFLPKSLTLEDKQQQVNICVEVGMVENSTASSSESILAGSRRYCGLTDSLSRLVIPEHTSRHHTYHYHLHRMSIDATGIDDNSKIVQTISQPYSIVELSTRPVHAGVIHIESSYGTVISNGLLDIQFWGDQLVRDNAQDIHMVIVGVGEKVFAAGSTTIASVDIEPGSWFYSLTPRYQSSHSSMSVGYPSIGYIEFIMSAAEILQHRSFPNTTTATATKTSEALQMEASVNIPGITLKPSVGPIRVCLWGSATMDGQKQIWLQQIKHLNKNAFRFTWVMTSAEYAEDNPVITQLKELPVNVVSSPFNTFAIAVEDLEQRPNDGGEACTDMWDHQEDNIYKYAVSRLHIAGGDVSKVSPSWCNSLFQTLKMHLLEEQCDIVVYGNSRGYSADALLTSMCRALHIPTVAELLNLFTHPEVVPDVIIGPSEYATNHHSVSSVRINATHVPYITVISPAVDIAVVNEVYLVDQVASRIRINPHPSDVSEGIVKQMDSNTFTIGFMGRLAPEKNPALFLLAAAALVNTYTHYLLNNTKAHPLNLQFRILGDGVLRPSLELLATQLGIANMVTFVGWLQHGTPLYRELQLLDVLVNPTTRAWSETFCIANIEGMAMGIPLVTTGVGGVGQYVSPISRDTHTHTTDSNYTVTNNAVLVHCAAADCFGRALWFAVQPLLLGGEQQAAQVLLLRDIGLAGRRTVINHFHVRHQHRQYEAIYQRAFNMAV